MRTICLAALLLVACGKDDDTPTAPEAAKAPTPPTAPQAEPVTGHGAEHPPAAVDQAESRNEYDLTFTGGLEKRLQGKGGVCAPGLGASFRVQADGVDFTILVTSEEEWTNPAILLNVLEPKGHWGRNRQKPPAGETIELARDHTSATVDTTLRAVTGGEPVKVKGTIRCPKT